MAMKSAFSLTPAKVLRAAQEHVPYEIQMLRLTAQALGVSQSNQLIANALLESFAVHLRALNDFFWKARQPSYDDVIAQDFMPQGTAWTSSQPAVIQDACGKGGRGNKEVVHLTYARIDKEPPGLKKWDVDSLVSAIGPVIDEFLQKARPDLVTEMHAYWKGHPLSVPAPFAVHNPQQANDGMTTQSVTHVATGGVKPQGMTPKKGY
jgi:hypothetical protein